MRVSESEEQRARSEKMGEWMNEAAWMTGSENEDEDRCEGVGSRE